MPEARLTSHRTLEHMTLPFVTFGSPISSRAHIRKGENTLTAIDGILRRRPGFSTQLELELTAFAGRITNIFTWRKFSGSFFVMVSETTQSNTSRVWKLEIGQDPSFVLIHTQASTQRPFHFLYRNGQCYFGCGTDGTTTDNRMWKYDGRNAAIGGLWVDTWGIEFPTVPPTTALVDNGSNAIDISVDLHYRYTYWDANTGSESSPSELNQCMGQATDKAVDVTVTASTNPRVTHIRIYRTRDGGSTDPRQMQELPASPIANATATVRDFAADADLRNRLCPQIRRNDPPPNLGNLVQTDARAAGSIGDTVWQSGFDEITNGVDIECWPSGDGGNWWKMKDTVGALAVGGGDDHTISVFMPGSIAQIAGELRQEIRRYTIDPLHGTRQQRGTFGLTDEVGWFDTSGTIRLSSTGDVSEDIRNTLEEADPQQIVLQPHVANRRNWLCVLDGASGNLYVLDADTACWQTPWPIGASTIYSGEIAPGQRVLLAAIEGEIWYMTEGIFNDRGTPYGAYFRTSLAPLAPDGNPDVIQAVDSVSIERDAAGIADILFNLDEHPNIDDSYESILANEGDPTHRASNTTLVEKRYTVPNEMSLGRRGSVEIQFKEEDADFELYSLNIETHTYESLPA